MVTARGQRDAGDATRRRRRFVSIASTVRVRQATSQRQVGRGTAEVFTGDDHVAALDGFDSGDVEVLDVHAKALDLRPG